MPHYNKQYSEKCMKYFNFNKRLNDVISKCIHATQLKCMLTSRVYPKQKKTVCLRRGCCVAVKDAGKSTQYKK